MKLIAIGLSILLLVGGGFYFATKTKPVQNEATNKEEPVTETPTEPSEDVVSASGFYYPINNYEARITNRDHGKRTTLADSAGFPCGGQFEGIHIGDDLEVTADEITKEIPVYAIADGKVRQASVVGGYGGLLVTEHTINNEIVTAYYGHIDLGQLKVKANDQIKAGDLLTYLGDNCSTETSEERKHLHFDIRNGSKIDVRGYIQSLSELAAWIDPTEFLKDLKAAQPGN